MAYGRRGGKRQWQDTTDEMKAVVVHEAGGELLPVSRTPGQGGFVRLEAC